MTRYPSVCPHDCPSACALEVEKLDAFTIGTIRGAQDNDYTRGAVCSKVAKYAERVHHPDRLTQPLKRVGPKGSDQFEPISWDEALDTVAAAFSAASQKYGAESVWPYYYAGTMGQIQRDGIIRLRNALGYSGQLKTICTQIAYAGWTAGCGGVRGSDPRELADSDLIVIWGGNPVATQINLMKHVNQARRERGAKLVVIDPSRTGTADKADLHLAVRPGTDGALACAVMHECFKNGHTDWDYLRQYTDAPEELQAHLQSRDADWAAEITGVSAEAIRQFAQWYGRTPKSFIRLGIGFSRSRNGAQNVHAVSCLPAITGAWKYKGGGALLGTSSIFKLDKSLIEGAALAQSDVRDLDMSRIGAILNGDSTDLKGGPPVTAMLIQNTNPMVVAPDLTAVKKGLAREDLFVCVHEQFLTETAKMADIVLPATSFLEHTDIYTSYGQVYMQLAEPVIQPLADCRPNHAVINGLAARLGAADPSFQMDEKTMIDESLKATGLDGYEALKTARWQDCSLSLEEMHYLKGFDWPDHKFRFKPDWAELGDYADGMPAMPDHWAVINQTDATHPFRLITSPARRFLNSSFTITPSSQAGEGEPTVQIHPQDAAELGVKTAARVCVGNQLGEVKLAAEVTDKIGVGVLEVRSIWPGWAFKDGIGINTLISAKPVAPTGGAAFHDTAVYLRKDAQA